MAVSLYRVSCFWAPEDGMRAFLRVEPTGTIASFEQVGIPMATELVGGIVFYPPPQKKTQTCKPSNTRAATPPLREEPPPIYTAHLRVSMQCPHWDSNPEHKDFKSSVSANWTMRAYPEQSGTQIFIIPRKRTRT